MSIKLRVAVLEDELLALLKVIRAVLSSDPLLERYDIRALLLNPAVSDSTIERTRRNMEQELNEERQALGIGPASFPAVCTELQSANPALAGDRSRILDHLEQWNIDFILTDSRMVDPLAGCFLIEEASQRPRWRHSQRSLCVMTQYPDLQSLFRDHGREDITLDLSNHFDKEQLLRLAADEVHPQLDAVLSFAFAIKSRAAIAIEGDEFCDMVGKSQEMIRVYQAIQEYAPDDASVLIVGETGTGKELVAKALHRLSHRTGQFISLESKSLAPDGLVLSELFGSQKGAFTGAIESKIGQLARAEHGTVFLDEIENVSDDFQQMLLRVIETKEFRRVGGKAEQKFDFRFVCATNQDPAELVRKGKVREDFYFRVRQREIRLPPLRERAEDIPLLVGRIVKQINRDRNRQVKEEISQMALRTLEGYRWPGNVRQLISRIGQALDETPDHSQIDANCNAFAELKEAAPHAEGYAQGAVAGAGSVEGQEMSVVPSSGLKGRTPEQLAQWLLSLQSPIKPSVFVAMTDKAASRAALERLRDILKARRPDDGRRVNDYLNEEFPKYIDATYGHLRNHYMGERRRKARSGRVDQGDVVQSKEHEE